eukprot:s1015_g21.t1
MVPVDELQGMDVPSTREDLPAGAYVIEPFYEDKVIVDGVELKRDSTLADLRAACAFHHLSTIGGKDKCYKRLINHQKQLELELIGAAAHWMDANVRGAIENHEEREAVPAKGREKARENLELAGMLARAVTNAEAVEAEMSGEEEQVTVFDDHQILTRFCSRRIQTMSEGEEFFTVDEYDADPQMSDGFDSDDAWWVRML